MPQVDPKLRAIALQTAELKYPARTREIIDASLELLNVQWGDIVSGRRMRTIVNAREHLVGALRHLTILSFPEIANLMGRKHHSSAFEQKERFDALPIEHQAEWLISVNRWIEKQRADSAKVPVFRDDGSGTPLDVRRTA